MRVRGADGSANRPGAFKTVGVTLQGMKRESVTEASRHLREVVDRARLELRPTILTDQDSDATVAVVVPAAQYEEYLRLRDAEDARRIREAIADERPGRVFDSIEELRAAAGLAPAHGAA